MKNDRNDKKKVSRRRFLGQASCAAVGTTSLFNTVLNMGMFNTLAGTGGDYRGMVCLFLSGGIDSFNLLVPRGQAEYGEYATTRADLALPQIDLLPVTPSTPDPQGREFGLHPNVPEIQSLFAQGDLALIANVGTLVEPTTLQQFQSRSVRLPLGLFSHSDQSLHWQTSIPNDRSPIGWGGRIADILQAGNTNQNISMNISLSGTNVFQTGANTSHYTIGPNGSTGLIDYGGTAPGPVVRTNAIDSLLGLTYQNVFEKTYAARMRSAIDAHLEFSAAIDALQPFTTVFSDNPVSQRFRMVAQTIAARDLLGMRRQTFFIETGGWDHHDEVLLNQEAMLPIISAALGEFRSALQEIGVADQVVTFTASDFGRTLSSNGRGSDHAWGGNHLVMGGGVRGGDIYGTYPQLALGSSLDTGRGRLIPSTSCDELFAELALWFGVVPADLEIVLPNIARFYSPGSPASPLGLFGGVSPADIGGRLLHRRVLSDRPAPEGRRRRR